MAAVCLWRADGQIMREAAMGDGPIDAVFKCIERITGVEHKLRDYRVRNITMGEDAQGEALVEVEYDGKVLTGRGVSTDIIDASAQAQNWAAASGFLPLALATKAQPPPTVTYLPPAGVGSLKMP